MRSTQIVVLLSLALFSTPAEARRFTRGDAEAVLHALGNGGGAILSHGADGAASHGPGLIIRPFFESGRHYCVLDWHLPSLGWVEFAFAPPATPECRQCLEDFYVDPVYYTADDAIESFSRIDNVFTLDGAPFDVIRTPLSPFNNQPFIDDFLGAAEAECGCDYGVTDAYFTHWGQVIGPADLGAGEHTLTDVFSNGDAAVAFSNTFFVDPAGSAICAQ
jgi:hypothetical protein